MTEKLLEVEGRLFLKCTVADICRELFSEIEHRNDSWEKCIRISNLRKSGDIEQAVKLEAELYKYLYNSVKNFLTKEITRTELGGVQYLGPKKIKFQGEKSNVEETNNTRTAGKFGKQT